MVLDNKETLAKSCGICGLWQETPRVVKQLTPDMLAKSKDEVYKPAKKPCPVHGCDGTMAEFNERSMCPKCAKIMRDYFRGQLTDKPPVMEINGELWRRDYYYEQKGAA